MNKLFTTLMLFVFALVLSGCLSKDDSDAPKKAAAPVVLVAPSNNDDDAWKAYLQQVVNQHMAGVTDRMYAYYLPANSTVPTPGAIDNKSQYDRQMENITSVVQRTVLPGTMLVMASPDSAKMADLIVAAFTGAKEDALSGSQVLFIGQAADVERVKAAVEASGAKLIFVEAK